MRAKAATFLCLVPESARSFCLARHASHGTNSRYCSSRIPCRASPAFSQCPPSSSSSATASGLRRRRERSLPRVERAGAHDHRSSDARSPSSMDPGQRVSRALNRALGNVLATGDMFGSVSKGVSDDDAFGRHWSSKIDNGVGDQAKEEDREEEQEEDEDEDGDYGGGDSRAQQDAADMLSGKNPLSLKKFGQRRSANRLLRAKTEASAAVVVDGPFRELQAYMTLPVSEYSLLDSSVIRRVSESSFRFQVPLKELVGLDFTPTMEVEVELDPQAKAVVFRSVRSTLYGNVGKPGEEANTNPWPEAATSKVEYFRVAFDARLRWVDGDASLAPRQRGRGGFTGDFTRRPRPAPPAAGAGPTGEATGRAAAAASGADVVGDTGDPSGGDSAPPAPLPAGEARRPKTEVLPEKAGPATVFCDTEIKVQVLLPPPYNTLLPWRLVRALLGKLLSTIVAYVLPRFLELLADDFYGWQSGARRAAATAGETSRTLLGAKDNSGSGSERERGGGGLGSAAAPQAGGAGQDAPVAGERDDGGARRRGGGGGGRRYDESSSSNNNNRRNPVVGGLQRLRNVRGPGGDRARTRAVTTSADAGEVAAVAAAAAAPSSAVTMQPAAQNASANQVSKAVVQEDLSDWAAPSVPSGGVSGDGFNFEVSVEDVREEGEGGDEPRQQRRRRGWMGGGNQDGDGGDGGSGGVSGGGGGQINWWG